MGYGGPRPLYQADAYNEADVTFSSFPTPYQSQFLFVHAGIMKPSVTEQVRREEHWGFVCVVH